MLHHSDILVLSMFLSQCLLLRNDRTVGLSLAVCW